MKEAASAVEKFTMEKDISKHIKVQANTPHSCRTNKRCGASP